MSLLEALRGKKSFIEGSQQNLPVAGQGETLQEIIATMLDPVNSRQLAHHRNPQDEKILDLLDAYAHAENENDVDGFIKTLTQNAFIGSAAIEGRRASQIQNMAVGQMNRNFAMELAQIKSGTDNKELKDAI